MSERKRRAYSVELKLKTLARMAAGEPVAGLAAEIGVRAGKLYEWRATYRANDGGLRRRGRPSLADALAGGASADELEMARRRIAELERQVGRQAFELDFFRGALRRIEASRPGKDAPGVTASSPRSRR
jgi:transposase